MDVEHDPFQFIKGLTLIGYPLIDDGCTGPFNQVQRRFEALFLSLLEIRYRVKIEACIGDVTCVLEQLRSDSIDQFKPTLSGVESFDLTGESVTTETLGGRGESLGRPNYPELEEYPKMFDRTRLSNVLGYVGATLSTFMYALPLTWPEKSLYVLANCPRNPNRWQSMAHFNNEYIALSAPLDLEKIFHIRMAPMLNLDSPLGLTDY